MSASTITKLFQVEIKTIKITNKRNKDETTLEPNLKTPATKIPLKQTKNKKLKTLSIEALHTEREREEKNHDNKNTNRRNQSAWVTMEQYDVAT